MPFFVFPTTHNTEIPTMNSNATQILHQLAAPFDPADLHFKPQAISGTRALAVAYLDSRAVQDRLDQVFGLNWSDAYEVLPSGSVVCRLTVQVNGQTITKTDVGSPSEQPDGGDRLKAAFSDALKRAAVKFGIGRYLYRLPKVWVDYDAQKRQLKAAPQLPAWALPSKPTAATINEEQARQLQRMLRENGRIDPTRFLQHFGAARLTQLPPDRFTDAVAMLGNPPAEILKGAA
jgi:hypothetical protein